MSNTTAQFLRDIAAKSEDLLTWDELDTFLARTMEEEAGKGHYSIVIPFEDLSAHPSTIEQWQRIAKQPQCGLNVVIQTNNQVNKELVIKWG